MNITEISIDVAAISAYSDEIQRVTDNVAIRADLNATEAIQSSAPDTSPPEMSSVRTSAEVNAPVVSNPTELSGSLLNILA